MNILEFKIKFHFYNFEGMWSVSYSRKECALLWMGDIIFFLPLNWIYVKVLEGNSHWHVTKKKKKRGKSKIKDTVVITNI